MSLVIFKKYFRYISSLIFIGGILFLSNIGTGLIAQAQMVTETPYDASEMSRRDRRFVAPGPAGGGDVIRAPGPRPTGPPVPPVRPALVPVPAPAPAPAPAPPPPPLPPSVIRGSGSNIGSVTLLFNPLSARIRHGTVFTQDIVVNNPRGTGYDRAEVMIKYNPEFLSVNNIESTIVPSKYAAAKVVVNEVDNKKGIIRFGIENKAANIYYSGAIATINWYAKKKTFGSRISYVFVSESSKGSTSITAQNRDILGASGDPTDGVVSATLSIQ
jgi:hypothetical protein